MKLGSVTVARKNNREESFVSNVRRNHFTWPCLAALFLAFIGSLNIAMAASPTTPTASVTLAWNPSPDQTVTGYRLYYGVEPEQYTNSIVVVGNNTSCTVTGLVFGVTYYFATTAYDSNGMESEFSNEVSYTVPIPHLEITSHTGEQVELTVTGAGSSNFTVEATEDLVNWVAIGTTTSASGGRATFVDEAAGEHSKRFYRIR